MLVIGKGGTRGNLRKFTISSGYCAVAVALGADNPYHLPILEVDAVLWDYCLQVFACAMRVSLCVLLHY